jgi:hypothetical protein
VQTNAAASLIRRGRSESAKNKPIMSPFVALETMIDDTNQMLDTVITAILTHWFANETFTIIPNKRREQSDSDSWEWTSSFNCMTNPVVGTTAEFSTTCVSTGSLEKASCFPADAQVGIVVAGTLYPQYGTVRMDALGPQHQLLTYNVESQTLAATAFMTMVHNDSLQWVRFRNITLLTTNLIVTPRHLLYRVWTAPTLNCTHPFHANMCIELVFAEELGLGDILLVSRGEVLAPNFQLERIQNLTNVVLQGVYSPMPATPYAFFVNQVLVSPFSEMKQWWGHWLHHWYACMVAELATIE